MRRNRISEEYVISDEITKKFSYSMMKPGSIVIGSNLLKRRVFGNYLYQERNEYYEKSWFF